MTAQNNTKKVTANIALAKSYKNEIVEIQETTVNIEFYLLPGEHTVTSQSTFIGKAKNYGGVDLYAIFTFWYNYNVDENCIYVIGGKKVCDNAPSISITTNGINQKIEIRGYSKLYDISPEMEVYASHLNECLSTIQNCVQDAARKIAFSISEASNIPVNVKVPTPEMPAKLLEKMSAVYKSGNFVELYDPSKVYGTDYSIKSIPIDIEIWRFNQQFRNVRGSNKDIDHGGYPGTWLDFWKYSVRDFLGISYLPEAPQCTSLHYPYPWTDTDGQRYDSFPCSYVKCGGHITKGTTAYSENQVPPYKEGDPDPNVWVYLIPICDLHNKYPDVEMIVDPSLEQVGWQSMLSVKLTNYRIGADGNPIWS